MNSFMYYIYEKLFSFRSEIKEDFWDIYQSKKVIKEENSHFLIESKVENLQKNP